MKVLRVMQKPMWFEINKKEFEELTGDNYNNQDNTDFEIIINNNMFLWFEKRKTFLDGSNYT